MPFYDDAPRGKKRKNYANEGSWEDEGAHYRGARRFGPDSEGDHRPRRQEGYRDGHASYAGRDNRRNDRSARPEERWEDRRAPRRADHPARYAEVRRPRPAPRRPEAAAPVAPPPRPVSYRDSEYRPASEFRPMREEPPVYENLLAGRNPIREALKSGRDLEKLLVQRGELSGSAREIVQMAKDAHVPVQEVEKSRLDEITRHHQGMLAFASAYQYSTVDAMLAEAAEKGEEPFLILLDGVTDPHNLGAIIRSALGRFFPIITGIIGVPASLLFDPDSFYYGVLPVLAQTAEGFGVAGVEVGHAAILGQMTVGFPISPLTASTFLLVGLAGVDFGEHQKKTIPLAWGVSIVMLIVAVITGGVAIF